MLRDALAEFIIGPAEGRTRWLGLLRMSGKRVCRLRPVLTFLNAPHHFSAT
jgi:hypothetical protein